MYISSILFYLSWPALIVLCYWLVIVALKRYEKISHPAEDDEKEIFVAD